MSRKRSAPRTWSARSASSDTTASRSWSRRSRVELRRALEELLESRRPRPGPVRPRPRPRRRSSSGAGDRRWRRPPSGRRWPAPRRGPPGPPGAPRPAAAIVGSVSASPDRARTVDGSGSGATSLLTSDPELPSVCSPAAVGTADPIAGSSGSSRRTGPRSDGADCSDRSAGRATPGHGRTVRLVGIGMLGPRSWCASSARSGAIRRSVGPCICHSSGPGGRRSPTVAVVSIGCRRRRGGPRVVTDLRRSEVAPGRPATPGDRSHESSSGRRGRLGPRTRAR